MSEAELTSILMLTGASELIVKADARPLDRERPIVAAAVEAIRAAAAQFLFELGHRVAARAREVGKAAGDEKDDPAAAVADADYDPLRIAVEPHLRDVAKDAGRLGLEQVGVSAEDLDTMLSLTNEGAVSWAEERAGELVTQIDETTRDRVRELVARAEDEGWSNDELADAIADDGVFGPDRADLIARTETAAADVQGNLIGWKESGVVEGKQWIVAQDGECDECAALDGASVGLDEEFPGGDPPLHPNCRCDVLPVLAEDDD